MLSLESISPEEVNDLSTPNLSCSSSDATKRKQQKNRDCYEDSEFINESCRVLQNGPATKTSVSSSASIPHLPRFGSSDRISEVNKNSRVLNSQRSPLSHSQLSPNDSEVRRSIDELSSFFQEAALDTDVEEEDRSIHLSMRDSVSSSRRSLVDTSSSFRKESLAQKKTIKADEDNITHRPSSESNNCTSTKESGDAILAPTPSPKDTSSASASPKDINDQALISEREIFLQMMSQVDVDNVAAALYPVRKTSLQLLSPVSGYTEPSMRLLPPQEFRFHGRHTLVLDLDETLVHASNIESDGFRPDQGDFKTDVIYDDKIVSVYVQVRPGLRNFLKEVSLLFEVVIFTASVEVYASAVIRVLDPLRRHIHHLLHRAHCTRVGSSFAKDLSLLHRPLSSVIIIDNSPAAYMFQPRNAIPCTSWFDDRDDNELLGLLPMLRHVSNEHDVFPTLDQFHEILSKITEDK